VVLPSTPVRARIGTYTTMMSWPNNSGRRASCAAANTSWKRSAGQRTALAGLSMGQSAHTVFDDHHRTVDDDAEVERPGSSGWR
jgi:hypothetical protein